MEASASSLDPARFLGDIERAARAIGAGFSREAVERSLVAFREDFADPDAFVWLKTVSVPGMPLSFRFIRGQYPEGTDLLGRARALGTFEEAEAHHPEMFGVIPNLLASHPANTKWMGVDFQAHVGPAKVWMWMGLSLRLRDLDRTGFPRGLGDRIGLLESFGFDQLRILAFDFRKCSVNLYFYKDPSHYTKDLLAALVEATFPEEREALRADEIVSSLWGIPAGLAFTMSWKKGDLERWCLYSHGLPYGEPTLLPPGFRLPPMPERFQRLDAAAGGYLAVPLHDISWSFGEPQPHMKYDRTYFGDPWKIGQFFGMPSKELAFSKVEAAGRPAQGGERTGVHRPGTPFELGEFRRDLERTARAIEAPFSPRMTDRCLEAFADQFGHPEALVCYRANSVPGTELSYRFGRGLSSDHDILGRLDAFEEVRRARKDCPQVFAFLAWLFQAKPDTLWFGVDFASQAGPAKIWLFPGYDLLLGDLDKSLLPRGAVDAMPLLAEFGLGRLPFVSVDFRGGSVNLYSYRTGPDFTKNYLQAFLDRTFPGNVPEQVLDDIVASLWGLPSGIGSHFSWKTGGWERWAIVSHGLPYSSPEVMPEGYRLPPRHERIERMDRAAGCLAEVVMHDMSWSFGRPFHYQKYDRLYSGSPWDFGEKFFPPEAMDLVTSVRPSVSR